MLAIAAAACSSDPSQSPTDRVTAYLQRVTAVYGYQLDDRCVRELVAQVPQNDLDQLLAVVDDRSPSPTLPELSTSGNALASRLSGCQVTTHNTNTELLERALAAAGSDLDGAVLDRTCALAALATFDDESLARLADLATGDTDPRLGAVTSALFACLTLPTVTGS